MATYFEFVYSDYFKTELPSHWQEKRLGFLAEQTKNAFVDGPFGSDLKSEDYLDEGVPLIQLNNIRDGKHILRNMKFISNKKKMDLIRHLALPQDIVIAKMAEPVARAAVVSKEYDEYVIVADCVKLTPNLKLVDLDFLIWAINADCVRENAELVSTGTTRIRINLGELKKLKVPYPTLPEQIKIREYLDHGTAKIDSLIAKQEKLIELLKEKRQAVISHAVTKGLNPDVNMKDSGVEWLGQVPEHWTVKSYRHASKIYRGKFGHRPRNDPAFYDGEYPFIQTGDVARAGKYITSYSQTLNEKGKEVSQLFPKGTLMMAIAANIGDLAILGFEAYAPDSVVGFKPNQDIDLEFLRYSFMAALPALEQISTQSTQANLNVERIGAVQGVFPSLNDQQEIVSYLDEMLNKYSVIEREMHKAIELLQERRTALISSAVTGKIDVRNWQNPNKNNEANTEFGA